MLFGNEIINEFFYAQLIGDLGFIFLLIVSSRLRQPAIAGLFAIVAVYALAWVYTASAAKLAVAILLAQLLALVRAYSGERVLLLIALALLLPLTIVIHPTFEPMVRNAAHDGSISITLPLVLSGATLLLLLAPSIWWLHSRSGSSIRCEPLVAAGIAISLLALVQFVFLRLGGLGSPYAVKKHGFLIGTFVVASSGRLVNRIVPSIRIVPTTPSPDWVYSGLRNAMDRRMPSRRCGVALARRAAGSRDQIRRRG